MGFLAASEGVVAHALAGAMRPPPPPDITRWCEQNIVFDERSPMPGPFRIDRFPFLREIHEVLSPEHPCREVTIRGSAQWGKTVSIIQPTLGAWHEAMPLDSLVVHPTAASATEWVDNKWLPMRRAGARPAGDLRRRTRRRQQGREVQPGDAEPEREPEGHVSGLTGRPDRHLSPPGHHG